MRMLNSARRRGVLSVALALSAAAPAAAQRGEPAPVVHANWELANKFSPEKLRSVIYSSTVTPRWLGLSDSLCYNWKDHTGSEFLLVVPTTHTKHALFDQVKLAAQLSTASHHAHDPNDLPFTSLTFSKDHKSFEFTADSSRWKWTLASETLERLGAEERQNPADAEDAPPAAAPDTANVCGGGGGGRGGAAAGGAGRRGGDFRNYAPDSSMFAFARDYNLYLVHVATKDTVQLSHDGAKNYSFGARDTVAERQQQELTLQSQNNTDGEAAQRIRVNRDPRVRANVIWSPDSKGFAVTRDDERLVKSLYLVNNTASPRPELMEYPYAMPGDEHVPQQSLYVWHVGDAQITPLDVSKWKDQRMYDIHWNGRGADRLRLERVDRTQRRMELIEANLTTHTVTPLIEESVERNSLERQNVRYVTTGGDMIWWSERSGWGHYYLYDNAGKLQHEITSGAWRAERITDVDSVHRQMYFTAVGREPGENPYYTHLYRVSLDGGAPALLDDGDALHDSRLSPTKKYIVDNYSRVDLVPRSVLRDANGKVVMDLETMDVSRLEAMGWKPPERIQVKAADGVTDLYGVVWKPFDFEDSVRKYPVIAHVYPGPQTESVTFGFSPTAVTQQLAQLGFIVVEVGGRGGSPQRSQEYQGYGYYNLRDYGIADKKAAIEELAARERWIDIDRVGIYGHSGGGFMTATAMMLPPYNDFFKVGVAESGNHDNNIYNQNWSEQYHGLTIAARGSTGRGGVRQAGAPRAVASTDGTIDVGDTTDVFTIHVPTTIDLAPNLKGNLLLETGDMDNNVHPANTIRLVNALIRANKRFDFMMLPGKPHGYGDMTPYTNHLMMEYFSEHLLGDYYRDNATIAK